MARRARKTPLEKYEEELAETYASIEQYENCLETLKERAEKLQEQVLMEKFRQVNELLEDQNLSLDDLKEILCRENGSGYTQEQENEGTPQIAS